ncbi:hypothetical protein [Nocardia sp. CA-145437]|uniref:hypothetical protein n=1 Tax=Nocardia sp. CA-145437 TaxID=3239980 RepID=UPI003D9757D3
MTGHSVLRSAAAAIAVGVAEFDELAAAPESVSFPPTVELRDGTQGLNGFAEVVLRDGSLYTRPRESRGAWRKVPTPGCLDGQVTAVSVDGNMLVAADRNGWIYFDGQSAVGADGVELDVLVWRADLVVAG